MTREELAVLCDARDKLCGYCEADECEKCIVTALINDAYNETPGADGDYTDNDKTDDQEED